MADTLDDLLRLKFISPVGEVLDLAGWFPEEIGGLGMPPIQRLRRRGHGQDGETDLGYRLEARTVRLKCRVRGETPQDLHDRRQHLERFFQPSLEPFILQVCLPASGQRELECFLTGGLDFRAADRKGLVQGVELVLDAPDPSFYDPELRRIAWEWRPNLEFPTLFPLVFGDGWSQPELDAPYAGSWRASPTITLTGPLSNPAVIDLNTGSCIRLETSLQPGETVVIRTRYGCESVTGEDGRSLMGLLDLGSDLSGFKLEPERPGRLNRFSASSEAGHPGLSRIVMEWNDRYLGI